MVRSLCCVNCKAAVMYILRLVTFMFIRLVAMYVYNTVYTEIFTRRKFSPILPVGAIGEKFFRKSFHTVPHTVPRSVHPLLPGG